MLIMQEKHEKRKVAEECTWFKRIKRALVVDDAVFSGSTLKGIQKNCWRSIRRRIYILPFSAPSIHKNCRTCIMSPSTDRGIVVPMGLVKVDRRIL